jgi:hypothetical protein
MKVQDILDTLSSDAVYELYEAINTDASEFKISNPILQSAVTELYCSEDIDSSSDVPMQIVELALCWLVDNSDNMLFIEDSGDFGAN